MAEKGLSTRLVPSADFFHDGINRLLRFFVRGDPRWVELTNAGARGWLRPNAAYGHAGKGRLEVEVRHGNRVVRQRILELGGPSQPQILGETARALRMSVGIVSSVTAMNCRSPAGRRSSPEPTSPRWPAGGRDGSRPRTLCSIRQPSLGARVTQGGVL